MKKSLLLVLFTLAISLVIAQPRPGKKYINFGYVSNTLTPVVDGLGNKIDFKSDFGGFYSSGKTYFLNPYPIANLLHFGIDVTFIDLNYSKYKFDDLYTYENYDTGQMLTEEESIDMHKAEVGMQVGPSVHLKIPEGLGVSVYARYAPSYSLLYQDDEFSSGFANMFTSGLTLNYKVFGVGVETRWGKTKHSFSLDIEDLAEGSDEESVKQKFDLKGSRVFLAFRF